MDYVIVYHIDICFLKCINIWYVCDMFTEAGVARSVGTASPCRRKGVERLGNSGQNELKKVKPRGLSYQK